MTVTNSSSFDAEGYEDDEPDDRSMSINPPPLFFAWSARVRSISSYAVEPILVVSPTILDRFR